MMKYRHALPQDKIFGWNEVKHFHKGQYILMHSVIFRTKLLRECGLELPEHMSANALLAVLNGCYSRGEAEEILKNA